MGLLDSLQGMAGQAMGGGGNTASVAGGLVEAVQQHPGGLGSILANFRNNGLGEHADAIQNGEAPAMSPDHVEQGLQGTGILESVAAKAGVSPGVAKMALAVALPMILAHFSKTGQAPDQGALGGMLSNVL